MGYESPDLCRVIQWESLMSRTHNPAKGKIKISYTVLQSKAVHFELVDGHGKIITTQTVQLPAGSGQTTFDLNHSGKPAAGEYSIKATGISNNSVRKIIITN